MRNTVVIAKRGNLYSQAMDKSQFQPSRPGAPECGDFDIRITPDGVWHYRGSPIGRMALVRLFASVLKRDDSGDYWLETPAERGRIQVDDAPFVAVELSVEGAGRGQRLMFRTNLDDMVTADRWHPIELRYSPCSPNRDDGRPYIHLRDGIEALIARPVYYALVELAEEQLVNDHLEPGVWSAGMFFSLIPKLTDGLRQTELPGSELP